MRKKNKTGYFAYLISLIGKWVFLLLLIVLPCSVKGQIIGGNSISILIPSGEFNETHIVGLGYYGNLDLCLTEKLWSEFELGYANWSSDDSVPNANEIEDINTFSVNAGLKYYFVKHVYVGARTGYYFKDLNEWVFIPSLGFRFGIVDINLGANFLDPVPFLNGRIGIFWAK